MEKTNTSNIGKIVSIFITLAGAVFFIIGCVMHGTSFGGDFYTYVYKGLAYIVQVLACILMGIGLIASSYFVMKNKEVALSQNTQFADMPERLPNL